MYADMLRSLSNLYDNLYKRGLMYHTDYSTSNPHYLIDLSDDGSFTFIPNYETKVNKKGKEFQIAMRTKIPNVTLDKTASFLFGKSGHIFGIENLNKYKETKELTLKVLSEIKDSDAVTALRNFYRSWDNTIQKYREEVTNDNKSESKLRAKLASHVNSMDNFKFNKDLKYTFSYKGDLLIDIPEVQEEWGKYFNSFEDKPDYKLEMCRVTGEVRYCGKRYLKILGSNLFSVNSPDSNSGLAYYNGGNNICGWYMPISVEVDRKVCSAFKYLEEQQKGNYRLGNSDESIIMWCDATEKIAQHIHPYSDNLYDKIEEISKSLRQGESFNIDTVKIKDTDKLWILQIELPTNGRKAIKHIWCNTINDYLINIKKCLDMFSFDYSTYKDHDTFHLKNYNNILGLILPNMPKTNEDFPKDSKGLLTALINSVLNDLPFPKIYVHRVIERLIMYLKSEKTKGDYKYSNKRYLNSIGVLKAYLIKNKGVEVNMANLIPKVKNRNMYWFGVLFRFCLHIQIVSEGSIPNYTVEHKYLGNLKNNPCTVFANINADLNKIYIKKLNTRGKTVLALWSMKVRDKIINNFSYEYFNFKGEESILPRKLTDDDLCSFFLGFSAKDVIFVLGKDIEIKDNDKIIQEIQATVKKAEDESENEIEE